MNKNQHQTLNGKENNKKKVAVEINQIAKDKGVLNMEHHFTIICILNNHKITTTNQINLKVQWAITNPSEI